MKQLFGILLAFCLCSSTFAVPETEVAVDTFAFTTVKEVPITSVKNQASSGTCWSFSGLGQLEAELLRQGKGETDLSEMFVVWHNFVDKAQKYVRMHGTLNFAAGGSFQDVLDCIKDYGIVPNEVLEGLNYGEEKHKHNELDDALKAYLNVVVKNPNKRLSTGWQAGFEGILDAYLGKLPEKFTYKGKEYTPKSYAQSLGLQPADYVSITSFTHHPFYTAFPLEIPDNWRWANSCNVPLDELMSIIDQALEKGYTVAWATDVSEKGFTRKGIAVVPDANATQGVGSDQAHWLGISQSERDSLVNLLKGPVPEKTITQAMRQEAFDRYETTDDHGMLIYGTAQDQNGTRYYKVKNSWDTTAGYEGSWYASVPFVQYKTVSIVVHKDVLSKELRKKLGL
ncbi:aminopeptidase C [Candidatus Symbiothrix dinenymphae]|uniref:aminopeptidase C n=1 Tax=Candidatus Symbiothrix dinenymphae TaxID=467085 RepID=UPI0006C682D1|nr:C1 family peptidase [Candidatus Symbiothrix dinenymphae]GAP72188.1 aminopeptidase C [Candidatus Symbiothrix dinenymphae]